MKTSESFPGPVQVVGIGWYRREHYAALKKIFVDGHKLPGTYDEWLKQAERLAAHLTGEGKTVVKAYIDPEHFPAWCKAKGLDIDAKARMEWGNETAIRKYLDKTGNH